MAKGDQQRVQERPGAHAYRRGYWYIAGDETMLVAAGNAMAANVIRGYPFRIRSLVQVVSLGTRITTGAAGLMQLAIYSASKRTLLPEGLPVVATGDIDASAAANVSGTVIGGSALLPRGLYWGMSNNNIGALQPQAGGLASSFYGALVGSPLQDSIAAAAATAACVRVVGGAYGVWPDLSRLTTTEQANQGYALLQFQVAP